MGPNVYQIEMLLVQGLQLLRKARVFRLWRHLCPSSGAPRWGGGGRELGGKLSGCREVLPVSETTARWPPEPWQQPHLFCSFCGFLFSLQTSVGTAYRTGAAVGLDVPSAVSSCLPGPLSPNKRHVVEGVLQFHLLIEPEGSVAKPNTG